MAIAGSATVAYLVSLDRDKKLVVERGFTVSASLCQRPEVALRLVQEGEQCVIAGSNIAALRELLAPVPSPAKENPPI